MTVLGTQRHADKSAGFTLVELMVSLLIVGIVMMGWWRIMNATSPYREAQRRAAVEVAAGVLDVFPSPFEQTPRSGYWEVSEDCLIFPANPASPARLRFPSGWLPDDSPIRYSLKTSPVTPGSHADWRNWSDSGIGKTRWWACIELWDSEDAVSCPTAFCTLEQLVYLWSQP